MDRSPPAGASVPPAETPGVKQLLALMVAVVIVGCAYLAREVLIPITLAILLAFVLAPLVQIFRKAGLPRIAAVLVAVGLSLSAMVSMGGLVGYQLVGLTKELPIYKGTIEDKLKTVTGLTIERVNALTSHLTLQLRPEPARGSRRLPTRPPRGTPAPPVPVEIHEPPPSSFDTARRILAPVIPPLATLALVIVVSVFMLLQQTDLRDRLIRLMGSKDLHRTTAAMDDAAARLSRYFLAQVGVNVGFGAFVALGLALIGVPHALLLGAVATISRFIPLVGGFVAAILAGTLAAAVDPGWSLVLWTIGFFIAAELLTGQVVEPFLFGHSTGLSPISVIVAAVFWSWLWGPIGLLLSTPLSLCLVVLGRHVPQLEFVEVLLGDRPPLSPVESCYQRVLAGDADECIEQAETLLKDGPISAYYDQITLKALQLAAGDLRRGVLKPPQLAVVVSTFNTIVTELAYHNDLKAPPNSGFKMLRMDRTPAPLAEAEAPASVEATLDRPLRDRPLVLCLAARSGLDEVATSMLCQLLSQHGFDGRPTAPDALSRDNLHQLDCDGVSVVCISSLAAVGGSTKLRYLVGRLRERMPDTPVVIGLWEAEDAGLKDAELQGDGGQRFVNSLRSAIESCVDVATGAEAKPTTPDGKPEATPSFAGAAI